MYGLHAKMWDAVDKHQVLVRPDHRPLGEEACSSPLKPRVLQVEVLHTHHNIIKQVDGQYLHYWDGEPLRELEVRICTLLLPYCTYCNELHVTGEKLQNLFVCMHTYVWRPGWKWWRFYCSMCISSCTLPPYVHARSIRPLTWELPVFCSLIVSPLLSFHACGRVSTVHEHMWLHSAKASAVDCACKLRDLRR